VVHEFVIIAHEVIRRKHRHIRIASDLGQSHKRIQDCGCRSAVRGLNHEVLRQDLIDQIAVMAFVRVVEHGENPILVDHERSAKASLFEQRCIADHGTKLLWGGVAANPAGYLRQTRAITSGENDCVSVLIRRVAFMAVWQDAFAVLVRPSRRGPPVWW